MTGNRFERRILTRSRIISKKDIPKINEQTHEKATIKLEDFNYDIFEKIVGAYDRIVGGRGSSYLSLDDIEKIKNSLAKRQPVEYRSGSKISRDSKLWIQCVPFSDNITFSFDPNTPRGDKKSDRLVEELELEFNRAVADILKSE